MVLKYCRNCGYELYDDCNFCPRCGTRAKKVKILIIPDEEGEEELKQDETLTETAEPKSESATEEVPFDPFMDNTEYLESLEKKAIDEVNQEENESLAAEPATAEPVSTEQVVEPSPVAQPAV